MSQKGTQKGVVLTVSRYGRGSAKRNRCAHCSASLKGKRPGARYCSPRCRQAAYRARHAPPKGEQITVSSCAHCGGGFWRNDPAQRYCSGSCRTMASRARREATIAAVSGWMGVSQTKAADVVEIQGLAKVSNVLSAAGFIYDDTCRAWMMPAGVLTPSQILR